MTTTCYHGRRLGPGGDTSAPVEVIAHDEAAAWRGPLVNFARHPGDTYNWGYVGTGPTALARSLMIDALGAAAMCPGCDGRGRVVWLGEDDPVPYDADAHGGADPDMVTRCYCTDGFRPLPAAQFAATVLADLGDHWRLTRDEVLDGFAMAYTDDYPPWVRELLDDEPRPARPVQDVQLP